MRALGYGLFLTTAHADPGLCERLVALERGIVEAIRADGGDAVPFDG